MAFNCKKPLLCLVAISVLGGCAGFERGTGKRPIAAGSVVQPEIAGVSGPVVAELPAMDCRQSLSQDQELKRSVVEQLANQGDWYAALAQVETLPPRSALVGLLRADILRQLDPVAAERWYRTLLTTCQSGRAEHGLALIEAARGRYRDALTRMQVAARAYPADARIRNDLGVLYLYLQDDARAAFELRTAHELDKDGAQPRFNLMLLALLQGDLASWRDLGARWQPPAEVRSELLATCLRVLSQRVSGAGARSCPINPQG